LDVDVAQVRAAREAASSFHALSLDQPTGPEAGPAELAPPEDDDPFAALDDSTWLRAALADLTDRERLVLRLRFVELLTQADIAERIGVSQMQVSRILRATLAQLRDRLEASLETAA
jgi:RNA polymerase sigma-B factor